MGILIVPDVIPTLYDNSLDFYNNLDFYAKNIKLSKNSIACISTGDFTNILGSSTLLNTETLLGFTVYKTNSVFVYKKRIFIFQGGDLVVHIHNDSTPYSFVDYCILYNYLLVFQGDGKFYWVNMENTSVAGFNTSLATDTTFIASSSVKIFSVTSYLGFLIISRDDNYVIWSHASISSLPTNWTYWAGNITPANNISDAAYTYFIGEPVYLGSYLNVIGVNSNVYSLSFTTVENYVSMSAYQVFPAYGKNESVMFTKDNAIISGNSFTEIIDSQFNRNVYDFVNIKMTLPCLRSLMMSIVLTSISKGTKTYMGVQQNAKLFMDGYIFSNGNDFYLLSEDPNNPGNLLDYFSLDQNISLMSSIKDLTFTQLGLSTPLAELIYSASNAQDTEFEFRWKGQSVVPVFDTPPPTMVITKTSDKMGATFAETVSLSIGGEDTACFRGKGTKDTFNIKTTGYYQLVALEIT